MRSERWWWLVGFCFVSLCIHIGVGWNSQSLRMSIALPPPNEIEIALEPLPPEIKPPAPEQKPAPQPTPPAQVKPERKPEANAIQSPDPPSRARPFKAPLPPPSTSDRAEIAEARPPAPEPDPGGLDPRMPQTPLPLGSPIGKAPTNVTPTAPVEEENPVASVPASTSAPFLQRSVRAEVSLSGGGSPAPNTLPGGRGGASGPPAPPEDIVFSGGGAGGSSLPKMAPRIGGGGGRSILSAQNPLALQALPEDKPGLGPGMGGGEGGGAGSGAGYGRGAGIGTSPSSRVALGTLRSKPGPGIGAGEGRARGTRSPRGGRGTGAELPGTGGAGFGYGRGSGIGIGGGARPGVGSVFSPRTGVGGNGGDRVAGLSRGIPFGDITGLLRGGDLKGGGGAGGGPGGSGRGTGKGGGGGSDAPVHMVYVLDISGSMRKGNMIGRAQEELKKALTQLKSADTFNIVTFNREADSFSPTMLPASRNNVEQATAFVDAIRLGNGTNISEALERALALGKVTHVFLLSDGDPTEGIEDFDELRNMVRERNTRRVRILTLALGLGDDFGGMALLKGLAEDNNGKFEYVNLAK